MGVMDHLNWGYIQLGLAALVFGGLQVWWFSSVLLRRNLAKPQSGGEFRKSLERIWKKEQQHWRGWGWSCGGDEGKPNGDLLQNTTNVYRLK
jgi:hypothetical protein